MLDSSQDYIMHVINGFDIMEKTMLSARIAMSSNCFISGTSLIICRINHTNTGQNYYVREWRVDVIIYHEQSMKNDYSWGSFIKNYTSIYLNTLTQVTLQSGLSSTDNLHFFGISSLNKNTPFSTPLVFNISSVTGASFFEVRLGPYDMSTQVYSMYFQITINCPGASTWNDAIRQCQNCSTTQYILNNNCVNCNTAIPHCSQCSSSSVCLLC
jgi:hypothetical protein